MGETSDNTNNTLNNQLQREADAIASAEEIHHYFSDQILNDISMDQYRIGDSMRIWLIEFKQQAQFAGVQNMTPCIRIIGKFMPTVIRNWIPTVPVNVKKSWDLFAEALNNQFGKNALEETREIKAKLRKLKQPKNESLKLHSAKWKHLVSLLTTQELDLPALKVLYIQSLYQSSLRTFLASTNTLSIDDLIAESIGITENAGLEINIHVVV